MTPEAITSNARLLDRKLRDLHQHRADLVVEADKIRHHGLDICDDSIMMQRMKSALRHRLQRIPALLHHVDREIEQAQADIDNFQFWHGAKHIEPDQP